MATFAWDAATMSTGVPEIDLQHQTLINTLNDLLDAMRQGKAEAQIAPILDFLARYTAKHFSHEEHCMARAACPAASANKAAHARFLATVERLRAQYRRGGATTSLILGVQRELGDWLRNHIIRTDAQLRSCAVSAA